MTICPKCNAQVPDGYSFCPSCGAPLEQAAPQNAQQPQQPYAQAPQQPQQNYVPQQNYAQAPQQPAYQQPMPPAKKKSKALIIIIIVVLVAALAVGGYFYFTNKDKDGGKDADTDKTTVSDTADTSNTSDVAPTEQPASPEAAFYGNWVADIDITDALTKEESFSEMMQYAGDKELKFTISMNFKFNEDNTIVLSVDEAKLDEQIEDLKDYALAAMCGYAREMVPDLADKTDEEVIAFMNENGLDVDSVLDTDELKGEFSSEEFSGKYFVEDGKLYLYETDEEKDDKNEYIEYTINSSNEIVLNNHYEDGQLENEMNEYVKFPLTLVR